MSSEMPTSERRRPWRRWLVALLLLATGAVVAMRLSRPPVIVGRPWPQSERVACEDISHEAWDELLRRYVDADGNIDYAGWKASSSDLNRLDDYLAQLSQLDARQDATKLRRLAFFINAYNAMTVRGILREYPTTSIQDHVSRIVGYNIWRDLLLIVGDERHSLGQIEHEILRPLNEPRIHFAIVCASRGCPRLLNEAYAAERLDEQLQQNALAFFSDQTKCSFDVKRHVLHLSPILSWYAADFGASQAERLQRISRWMPDDTRALATSGDVYVDYFDYDWALNDQATAGPPLPPLP